MKSMVVVSSKTGNTRQVAQAIFDVLPDPKQLFSVEEAPDPEEYDFLALGFWVDKGTADAKARAYFEKVTGKKVGLFGTLGAYPDSDHARQSMERARALLEGNELLGDFLCQGRVDPKLVKMMAEKFKDDPHHSMTPERKARLAEAEKHPDDADLKAAAETFTHIAARAQELLTCAG